MKQKNNFFRILCLLLTGFLTTNQAEAIKAPNLAYYDSVEVSLLTCSPHEEIYSLYGHSALRWHDLHQYGVHAKEDVAYNWGIFNFDKPFFVARFVFGLTDYELGPVSFDYFCNYYSYWGSSVTEQVLNLTSEEKYQLKKALWENLQPENRIYRYNYFYDNCSTRPRNIIEKCLNGTVKYAEREDYKPTYREMIHVATRHHPWAQFGNDILLGLKADRKTTLREQEFLPENLLYDFDRATIYADGLYRPLVKERRMVVTPGVQVIEQDFPLTPSQCAWILLVVSIVLRMLEWKRRKSFVWWDILLMSVQGLAGCILFLMLFSQHPTTSTNLQILLLNPLPLFYIGSVARRRKTRWWRILVIMTVLFLLGSLFQDYAEGMIIVALSLLTRVKKDNG